jgi:predicted PurR-regulated permease PerM
LIIFRSFLYLFQIFFMPFLYAGELVHLINPNRNEYNRRSERISAVARSA